MPCVKKYQKLVHNRCARFNLCNLYKTWHFYNTITILLQYFYNTFTILLQYFYNTFSKDALKRLRFIQSRTMIWKQVGDQIMTMSYHWTAIYMPFIRQTFMMPLIRQIIIKIEYHNRSCWMRFAAYCFRQRRQPGELLPPQQAPAAD